MKTACILLALVLFGITTAVLAQTEKPSIAVWKIKNSAGVEDKIVAAIDGMLITALHNTGKFKIVERKDLGDIEDEQEVAGSGKVDPNDSSLAQENKTAAVKYYVLGNISAFVDRTKESIYESMGVATTQHISSVSLDIRISDTTTGQVIQAVTVSKEKKETDAGTTTVVGSPNLNTGQLAEVMREAVNDAAVAVVAAIYPIQVMEIEESTIFLNRGTGAGVEANQLLEIFAPGKALKDPDTGEIVGSSERKVGSAQVREILPRFSKATILENNGITIGNICRPKQ